MPYHFIKIIWWPTDLCQNNLLSLVALLNLWNKQSHNKKFTPQSLKQPEPQFNTQIQKLLSWLEHPNGIGCKVQVHKCTTNFDHAFVPRPVDEKSLSTCFTVLSCSNEDTLKHWNTFDTEIISECCCSYWDGGKRHSIFYNRSTCFMWVSNLVEFVKNMRIGILPELCWRQMFSQYFHNKLTTKRKTFINCGEFIDIVEHPDFYLWNKRQWNW